MREEKPPQYVAYPRPPLGGRKQRRPTEPPRSFEYPAADYGSVQQLRALTDGYKGMSRILAIYLATVFVVAALSFLLIGRSIFFGVPMALLDLAVIPFFMFASKPRLQQMAWAMRWSKGRTLFGRFLMSFSYCCLSGLPGYIFYRMQVARELEKYSVRLTLVGVNKSDFEQAIVHLRDDLKSFEPAD